MRSVLFKSEIVIVQVNYEQKKERDVLSEGCSLNNCLDGEMKWMDCDGLIEWIGCVGLLGSIRCRYYGSVIHY